MIPKKIIFLQWEIDAYHFIQGTGYFQFGLDFAVCEYTYQYFYYSSPDQIIAVYGIAEVCLGNRLNTNWITFPTKISSVAVAALEGPRAHNKSSG